MASLDTAVGAVRPKAALALRERVAARQKEIDFKDFKSWQGQIGELQVLGRVCVGTPSLGLTFSFATEPILDQLPGIGGTLWSKESDQRFDTFEADRPLGSYPTVQTSVSRAIDATGLRWLAQSES